MGSRSMDASRVTRDARTTSRSTPTSWTSWCAAPGTGSCAVRLPTDVIAPVRWERDRLVMLDQRQLPGREIEDPYTRWEEVADAIRTLAVRGAPAIGVAAAFGVVLAAR